MNRTVLILIMSLAICFDLAFALSTVELHFISPQREDFSNNLLTLQIGEGVQKAILQNSTYFLELVEGSYSLNVIIDSFDTPAPDFYGTTDLVIGEDNFFEVLVFPTGFVQGNVKDTSGNLIPHADLNFNCVSSFIIPNVPEASCTLIASTANEAGQIEFKVEKGKAQDLEVILESKVASEKDYTFLIIGTALMLIIIGAVIYFYIKKKKINFQSDKKEKGEKIINTEELKLSSQTKALLETLSEKEKSIVNFLLENNNKSSQSKIRHVTRMPRTSLARVLQGLEAKKIILIEKEGKMVLIKLTPLFLGK